MKKKSKRVKSQITTSDTNKVGIDYEKLAAAIVKAQRAVTNNTETAKDNIEKSTKSLQ